MSDFLRPSAKKALIIDGKIAAASVVAETRAKTEALIARGVRPGLAVVLVGDDPASGVYVRSKSRMAESLGFHSVQHNLPADVAQADLNALVEKLNADPQIHGILVQLPLPKGLDTADALERIDPRKDVDGIHPVNAGLLATGAIERALVPCTPFGSMGLIERTCAALGRKVEGAEAIVIGRSNLMGKPMAQLLLAANATVTMAHSRTRDLPDVVRRADIVVAAVGQPEMVRGDWIKDGAIVIDVGINRVPTDDGKYRLTGDVAYEEALERAAAVTPVPGGVGQMTVPLLMANTVEAARRANP
ncbi:MAG: bifunctional methylenetetrahydrofolate dehydrogenase/methenyltetrahydrofolate cyclohydrolase FolD [Rhodoblastus sp.]|nr:bifunctional methylenetetrahydrofolate dehydrogenase/methenyltetrahydrofolate cyclohydrolase FolD [Rhodoblastus sp.]MCB9999411.1 bifunctional methylenetetrahydrofolate dehydrogenase/methenyltetrahydrofolate cyclohydrolase FolD [Methylobacteriaceae bacterium]MCC0003535.1 bifunctional methylenetetrahydrofolate dehydrogenase/methenyltetrahydrofolate cyclohydrolase FolD [Methylobacteriaceae bacterium]MCO5085947.1 bifunctional methylenetetrahydrofolate dehydrogenase/methenyltetrahydrofolate cycloh